MIEITDREPRIEDPGTYALAIERMRRLFKTDEMRDAATFAAVVHVRAADYIEQAPVLACFVRQAGGKRKLCNGDRIYAALKVNSLCLRGVRLKDVLASYGLALPLRKIKAKAISLDDASALAALARLPASVLSQAIPNSIVAQRKWLTTMREWMRYTSTAPHLTIDYLEWVAVQTARHQVPKAQIGTIGDFIARGDMRLNRSWSWQRAMAACDDWHDRLAAGDAKAKFGVMADQVIDLGEHPDSAVVGGLEFVALRTPMAIHAEGSAMRHCVASYVRNVIDGRCHIISVRRDEQRLATLELETKGLLVRQLKGRFNTPPDQDVQTAARRYAFEVRLALSPT